MSTLILANLTEEQLSKPKKALQQHYLGLQEEVRSEETGFDRLMASPTAQHCVRCQSRHERIYTYESNSTL
ncbi:MAG: TraR/DksA C4-type zinc finger protein [Nitrosomonadaceae bacterium]